MSLKQYFHKLIHGLRVSGMVTNPEWVRFKVSTSTYNELVGTNVGVAVQVANNVPDDEIWLDQRVVFKVPAER